MGKNWSIIMAFAIIVWVGTHTALQAQKGTDRGQTVFVPVASESLELPDGRTVQRAQSTGYVIPDNSDSPFYMVNQTCFTTSVIAADGSVSMSGYCDTYDSDGDVYWAWLRGDAQGGTWGFLGGTGKFEGIEGSGGKWKAGTTWPDGKWVVSWEGSWKMK